VTAIDPNAISEGEQVIVQDEDKNLAEGPAAFDEKGQMLIHAFRTDIVIARWSQKARAGLGAYAPVKGIKIVGHQAPIDALAFDVVPRQRFGGSNPT
jgi:hypothetical protein